MELTDHTQQTTSPGRGLVVPSIPPCNPMRLYVSQTAWDGDATGGATDRNVNSCNDASSRSWASLMDELENSDLEGSDHQDDFPTGLPVGGRDWNSQVDDNPEAVGPSNSMLPDPPATDEEKMKRDHDSWRESLRQELVLTQGYFVGWDSLECKAEGMVFKP